MLTKYLRRVDLEGFLEFLTKVAVAFSQAFSAFRRPKTVEILMAL